MHDDVCLSVPSNLRQFRMYDADILYACSGASTLILPHLRFNS